MAWWLPPDTPTAVVFASLMSALASVLGPSSEPEGPRGHSWEASGTPCWEPPLGLSQAACECLQRCPGKLPPCLLNYMSCFKGCQFSESTKWKKKHEVLGRRVMYGVLVRRFAVPCHVLNPRGEGRDAVCKEAEREAEAGFPRGCWFALLLFCFR